MGRMMTAILLIGLASILMGLMTIFFVGRSHLETAIGTTFEEIAKVTARNVDRTISYHVRLAETLSLSGDVVRTVTESNNAYEGSTTGEIAQQLAVIESRWAQERGVDAYLHALLTNEATGYFRAFNSGNTHPGSQLQILATDAHGAVVAATKRPSHYAFSDTDWWQQVMSTGAPFISDVEYSDSEQRYVLSIAVPVRQGHGSVAGVLHTVYDAVAFFKLVTEVHMGKTDHTMLVSSDGIIIFCPVLPIKQHSLDPALQHLVLGQVPGWVTSNKDVHYAGRQAINGFAPVDITFKDGGQNFGGKHWYIMTSQDPSEAFAPITGLLQWVALTGLIGALAIFGFAYLAARRIVTPLKDLREGVEKVAAGDLEHNLSIPDGAELEGLATAFNRMSEKLKASYSGLEAKITERTRALEAKNRELFALYNIVTTLNRATHDEAGMANLLHRIMVTMNADGVVLTTQDAEGGRKVHSAPQPLLEKASTVEAVESIERYARRERQPLFVGDLAESDSFAELAESLGHRSAAVIPITVRNRVIGVLTLFQRETHNYSSSDRTLINSIAHQLGAALEYEQHGSETTQGN